ncbi:replication protein A 70 kDa DNA-binding subunit B-like [Coffea eugenioides]|uniref:replication protein A 70 kDa DNA-binding subunit B-like n=1 Tax=Coffea eugenioides TaxID=49369 RepID=UPI000F60FF27|nr:replication protein A 70 kDa DNA-binding subunit B-like [Coffea eugenioides]
MNSSHKLLNQLTVGFDSKKIKVRVTRMWDAINTNTGDVFALEMVLLDENDNHMVAIVPKNLVQRFRPQLLEGDVYILEKFRVTPRKQSWNVVHNEHNIYFTYTTLVKKLDGRMSSIKFHKFEFIDFNDLSSRCQVFTFLSGMTGESINVTLWGTTSNQFNDENILVSDQPLVLVISSVTVKQFRDKIVISIDITAPQTIEVLHPPKTREAIQQLMFKNRKFLSEIYQIMAGVQTEELVYTSKVTILKVDFNSQLHYKAYPKCQRKVTLEGSNFVCNACNQNVEYLKLRYMLKVLASDATGSAWFVIFDQEAERIIEHKLSFVLEEFNKEGFSNEIVSSIINKITWKPFVFQIKLNNYNLEQGSNRFTVTRWFHCDFERETNFMLSQIGGTNNQYQPEVFSSQIPISTPDDSNQEHFNTLHMNNSSEGSTKITEEGNPHKKICMRSDNEKSINADLHEQIEENVQTEEKSKQVPEE